MPGRFLASLHAYDCTGSDFFKAHSCSRLVGLISPLAGQDWTKCKYPLLLERFKVSWYTFLGHIVGYFYTSIPCKQKNTSIEGKSRTCLSSEDYEAPDRTIVSKQWSHVYQTATLKDSYGGCFRATCGLQNLWCQCCEDIGMFNVWDFQNLWYAGVANFQRYLGNLVIWFSCYKITLRESP